MKTQTPKDYFFVSCIHVFALAVALLAVSAMGAAVAGGAVATSSDLTCAGTLDLRFTAPLEFQGDTLPRHTALFTGTNIISGPELMLGPYIAGLVQLPDGKYIVAGQIASRLSLRPQRLLRLFPGGGWDESFKPELKQGDVVRAMALGPEGKVILAGRLNSSDEEAGRPLIRLNADGQQDATFDCPVMIEQEITALAVQPDGKILVAASDHYSGAGFFGRFTATGERDVTFSAPANVRPQFAILRQPDGKWIVDGLTRLEIDGALDPTFQAAVPAGFIATAAVLQPDGRVVLAGGPAAEWDYPWPALSTVALRLNADGSCDSSFHCDCTVGHDPDVEPTGESVGPRCLALQPNGQILMGGVFTDVNGERRPSMIRLNSDGTLDASLRMQTAVCVGCDQIPVEGVDAILPLDDSQALVAGEFSDINGIRYGPVARVPLGTGACAGVVAMQAAEQTVWETNEMAEVVVHRAGNLSREVRVNWHASAPQYMDRAAERCTDFWPTNGVVVFAPGEASRAIEISLFDNEQVDGNRSVLIRLETSRDEALITDPSETRLVIQDNEFSGMAGTIDDSFVWPFDKERAGASCFAVTPDSHVIVATVDTATRPRGFRIVRLNADGGLDAVLAGPVEGGCYTLVHDPGSGAVIFGGSFVTVGGLPHTNLCRVMPDGTIDPGFSAQVGQHWSFIGAMHLLGTGELLVGGVLANVNPPSHSAIARLHVNGELDETFETGGLTMEYPHYTLPGTVRAMAPQADGKILIIGEFNRAGTVPCTNIVRLNGNGSVDTSFVYRPPSWGAIDSLAVQPDQQILLGGNFNDPARGRRVAVLRLNPDGSVDPSFSSEVQANPRNMSLQPDGRIFLNATVRLSPDGSVDRGFFAPSADLYRWDINMTEVLPSGELLVAGQFTRWNGLPHCGLVRLRTADVPGLAAIEFTGLQIDARENGGAVTIGVRRIAGISGAASATIVCRDGSAVAGQDYTAITQTVTFADGEAGSREITVPILNDEAARGNRDFSLVITNVGAGVRVGPNGRCFVHIVDDEAGVGFTPQTIDMRESGNAAYVAVQRIGNTNEPVYLHLATAGGTAIPFVDYRPLSLDLTIPANAQWVTAMVEVYDNELPEPGKTIGLVLSDAVGAQLAGATGTIAIHDDDRPARIARLSHTTEARWRLSLDVPPNSGGILQASTNLVDWVDVQWYARELPQTEIEVEEAAANVAQRFYRIKTQ